MPPPLRRRWSISAAAPDAKPAALISDMSQPLGHAVGNALEVIEAIEILGGSNGGDLLTVSLALASHMLVMGGMAQNEPQAQDMLADALHSGRSLDILSRIIAAQGGDSRVVHDTSLMPQANIHHTVTARQSGYLSAVDCRSLGLCAGQLGAGRLTKDDVIDPSVGFICRKRIGDRIDTGDVLFDVHANDETKLADVLPRLESCLSIGNKTKKPPLIARVIV